MERPLMLALLLVSGIMLLVIVLFQNSRQRSPPTKTKTTTASQCPVLIWGDDFDGSSLDTENKWEVQLGDGCDIGLCGWGNSELQSYTRENVIVQNGTLKIVAKQEGQSFTSSRIRTMHKADFVHGRFEARIRLPTGRGVWPAFWMMPTYSVYGGWPRSGEVDIMENIGHEVSTVHGTLHYSGDPMVGNHLYSTQSVNLNGRFTDDFHEFAIEKRPNEIRWFLDGAEYFLVTNETVPHWPFEEPFHFILNVAIGGLWPGNPDETTTFPQVMEVDHVRVHDISSASFGKLTGPRVVMSGQQQVVYSLEDGTMWDSYSWEVPEGATISQNVVNAIMVDFGGSSGAVKVTASSEACGETKKFSIAVTVGSFVDFIFVDGADTKYEKALLVSTSGTYDVVPNPSKGAVNPSTNVIRYIRDGDALYDTIFYSTSAIHDPNDYVKGRRRFSLDVFTTAPAGTPITLQLENSLRANPSNYPIGRHSLYQATLPENAGTVWKKFTFTLLDRPDAFETEVDTIVILFHPNSLTNDTYYFDNLESFSVADPPQ